MSRAVKSILSLVAGVILTLGVVGYSSGATGDGVLDLVKEWGTTTSSSDAPGPAHDVSAGRPGEAGSDAVPAHVLDTLALIDAGDWPEAANAPGTRGGDRFGNREGRLPQSAENGSYLDYREWDVNPKEQDRGRDAERIVTGSDGSAWYTDNHYSSFVRVR